MSEEDERSSEEEERSEAEEEVQSDEGEEGSEEVSKGEEEGKKERTKKAAKHQFAKLPTPARPNSHGKTTGSFVKQKISLKDVILSKAAVAKRDLKRKIELEEEEEEEEEEEPTVEIKIDSKTNKPTITFGKSTVRDYSQPAKKYSRDKFLLGKFLL